MLTAYESKLLTSYLANIASGLKRRDPEARELIDWIADRDNRIASGARRRRRRRHLGSDLKKEKITAKKLRNVEESLRQECSDIPARRDRTALRLRRLGKTAGLNGTDIDILELLLHYETHAVFESMIDDIFEAPGPSMNVLNPRGWAMSLILGFTARTIQSRLQDGAPLVRSGLVSVDNDGDLAIPPRLRRLATAPGDRSIDVTRLLLDIAPPADLEWTDFNHIAADRDHVERLLRGALSCGKPGVNVLLYGPPGTGKTEFCKALAARLGATLYSVGEADDDGDEPSRKQRLQELRLAQRLIANDRRSLLLFDEMEDLLEDSFGGFGMFGPLRSSRSREAASKVFMHRLLEQAPAPTLWSMNDADEVSPAILRRMMFALELRPPTAAVRTRVWERQLDRHDIAAAPEEVATLASEFDAARGVCGGRDRRRQPRRRRHRRGAHGGPQSGPSPLLRQAAPRSPGRVRSRAHPGRHRSHGPCGPARGGRATSLLALPAGSAGNRQERLRPLPRGEDRPGGHAEAGVRSDVHVGGPDREDHRPRLRRGARCRRLPGLRRGRFSSCGPAPRPAQLGGQPGQRDADLDGEPSLALRLHDQFRGPSRPGDAAPLRLQGDARLSRTRTGRSGVPQLFRSAAATPRSQHSQPSHPATSRWCANKAEILGVLQDPEALADMLYAECAAKPDRPQAIGFRP